MKIILLLTLLIFTAEIGHAQKFDALIKSADELKKAEKLSDALIVSWIPTPPGRKSVSFNLELEIYA